jgi:hypothetical protein
MPYDANWLDNAMYAAKHTPEPEGASEFGGAPGPDPHAHADPPPTHRGYPDRYMPITPAQSADEISVETAKRGTGSPLH